MRIFILSILDIKNRQSGKPDCRLRNRGADSTAKLITKPLTAKATRLPVVKKCVTGFVYILLPLCFIIFVFMTTMIFADAFFHKGLL